MWIRRAHSVAAVCDRRFYSTIKPTVTDRRYRTEPTSGLNGIFLTDGFLDRGRPFPKHYMPHGQLRSVATPIRNKYTNATLNHLTTDLRRPGCLADAKL